MQEINIIPLAAIGTALFIVVALMVDIVWLKPKRQERAERKAQEQQASLSPDQLAISDGKCPDCYGKQWYQGPQGCGSVNWYCANDECGSGFNVFGGPQGMLLVDRIGTWNEFKERMGIQ